jgi:hypothetical protein
MGIYPNSSLTTFTHTVPLIITWKQLLGSPYLYIISSLLYSYRVAFYNSLNLISYGNLIKNFN